MALVLGEVGDGEDVLVRVHSECLTGDVFGSLRCDCGDAARRALEQDRRRRAAASSCTSAGHEGRAIGLAHKLRAYELQDAGPRHGRGERRARVPGRSARLRHRRADPGRPRRPHDAAADEQPGEAAGLEGYGLSIAERVPLETEPTPENIAYLRTKREKLGHLLDGLDADAPSPGRRRANGERRSRVDRRGDAGRRIASSPRASTRWSRASSSTGALAGFDALGVRGRRHRRRVGARRVRAPAGRARLRARRAGSTRVVCLGAVIRGETAHFDLVASEAARGIADVARDTGVPVIFEVLTTETLAQAEDRAGGAHGNKGWDAADGRAPMVSVLEQLPEAGSGQGASRRRR